MTVTDPGLELVVHNPEWTDGERGGFQIIPLTASDEMLSSPDFENLRDIVINGWLTFAREQIVTWFDEQRAAVT